MAKCMRLGIPGVNEARPWEICRCTALTTGRCVARLARGIAIGMVVTPGAISQLVKHKSSRPRSLPQCSKLYKVFAHAHSYLSLSKKTKPTILTYTASLQHIEYPHTVTKTPANSPRYAEYQDPLARLPANSAARPTTFRLLTFDVSRFDSAVLDMRHGGLLVSDTLHADLYEVRVVFALLLRRTTGASASGEEWFDIVKPFELIESSALHYHSWGVQIDTRLSRTTRRERGIGPRCRKQTRTLRSRKGSVPGFDIQVFRVLAFDVSCALWRWFS